MDEDLFQDDTDSPDRRRYHCPSCHKPLRRIEGRLGPFWGCTAFPACKTRLFDKDGKPSAEPDERYRCPVCTRPLARASADKGNYWFCTGYNRGCKVTLQDEEGKPALAFSCRVCGHLLKKRLGRKGVFWGCSQYPECMQTYRDLDGRPEFG